MTVAQAASLGLSFAPLPFSVSKLQDDDEDEVHVEDETLMIGSISRNGYGPASGEKSVRFNNMLYKGVSKECYDMALFSKSTGRKVDEAESRAARKLSDGMHERTLQALEDLYGNFRPERWKPFDMKCKEILSGLKESSDVKEDLKQKFKADAYDQIGNGVRRHLEDSLVISLTEKPYGEELRRSVFHIIQQEGFRRALCHRSDFVASSDERVAATPYCLTQDQAYIVLKLVSFDVKDNYRFSVVER